MRKENSIDSRKGKFIDNRETNKSFKGVRFFIELNRLIDGYLRVFDAKPESPSSREGGVFQKDQRLERIKKINTFVEQIEQRCTLEEEEKLDCLIESLQIVKKISQNLSTNEIQTRSKRLSFAAQQKAIQQVQMSVIHNMTELILLKMTPSKRTQNNIINFISTVIEQLSEYQPQFEEDQQKHKTKKPNKQNMKDRVTIDIHLKNGGKIDLIWFLVFRITQRYLENYEAFCKDEKFEKKEISFEEIFQKHVNRHIKQIIRKVIIEKFSVINLWRDLLKAIAQAINQIELPIVPFFLKNVHSILQQKIKIYFKLSCEKQDPQKINTKELYSLQNISILLEMINRGANEMIDYQSSRIQAQVNGVCSYCGTRKVNMLDRSLYQKIAFDRSDKKGLTLTVCEDCCRNLQSEPTQNVNFTIFAPLLLTWFEKDFERTRMVSSKSALMGLMTYNQSDPSGKKHLKNKKIESQIKIPQRIAIHQEISQNLILTLYNRFIFQHSNLSLKNILINLLQMVIIFWNFRQQKLRQKSIKMLNKPYIVSFLFDSANKGSQIFRKEVNELGKKIITCLYSRLRDCSSIVSLTSLEFLAEIFTRGCIVVEEREIFFDSICKSVEERRISEYICKILDIIEKIIMNFHSFNDVVDPYKSVLLIRVLLKSFKLSKTIIESSRKEGMQSEALSDSLSRLLNMTLNCISSLCEKQLNHEDEIDLKSQFQFFLKENEFGIFQSQNLQEFPSKMLQILLSSVILSSSLVKNIPLISSQTIIKLLCLIDQPECTEEIQITIKDNICLLLDMNFQDVTSLNEQICFRKRRESKSIKNTRSHLLSLGQYMNSSSFIELLAKEPKQNLSSEQNSHLPNRWKLHILDRLLYFNNINNILCRRREVIRYMNIWEKTKRKSISKTLDPIVLSSNVEERLECLSQELLEATKSSNSDEIDLQGSLLVNIKAILDRFDDLKSRIIFIYQKYCLKFYDEFLGNILPSKTTKNNPNMQSLLMNYRALSRCLHITSVLVVKLQQFILFNQKIEDFYQNQLSEMTEGKSSRAMNTSLSRDKAQLFFSSQRFKKMYCLVLSSLSSCPEKLKKNAEIFEQTQKILQLLRYYWQVNPKSMLSDQKLLIILNEIDENTLQGFTIMKSMYKLFESLLPTQHLQTLNFIRQQFARRFHKIIKSPFGRSDLEFIESAFGIIYHLLKCGMEGLYQYNKYIFYGLLSGSTKVNLIAVKIIKDIYMKEGSQKILFINLKDSFDLLFESYFQTEEMLPFCEVKLTQKQKESITILSQITRKKAQVYFGRDKREIRIKTTFVKKVGDLLGSDLNLLKTKPRMLMMILQLLKGQRVLDYIELSEIIYSLDKIVKNNHLLVEDQLEKINKNIDSPTFSKKFVNEVSIVTAYRDLLSCLAYLSKYHEVTEQRKAYHSSFEQSGPPYTQLEEIVSQTVLDPTEQAAKNIQKIEQQIDMFRDFVEGDVEVMPSRGMNRQQPSEQHSESSSMTVLTKAKVNSNSKDKEFKQRRPNKLSESVDKVILNSSLEGPSIEADNIKTRLRRQAKKDYPPTDSEC